LAFLDHHLGHRNVARRWFVEGGGYDLPLHRALHVRHFLGPFVDQKDDQVAFGVIGLDRMRDVLQQNRLARPRRRHDQRTLAFPDRRHQVDDPGRAILDRRILDFHLQPLIGIKRREVVEGDLVLGAVGSSKLIFVTLVSAK
jgi:hypothetical protein